MTAINRVMPHEMPDTFTRRARLSSKAILAAVALTLAALAALAIASHESSPTAVKTLGPVTELPSVNSGLVPVVDIDH
jgi:hypothetical protein